MDLEKEKNVITLRELLEDCIRDSDNTDQPPELAVSCASLRTWFHSSKFFKLRKIRLIKPQPSFPPSCVPNVTKSKSKSIGVYSPGTSLVTFSLSELRNATNNFSNGLLSSPGFQTNCFSTILVNNNIV